MSRYDKYDPVSGGFRAPLAAAYTGSETLIGVGLDVNGRVVPGAGNSGLKGVMVNPLDKRAGDIVDVMTDGEVLEFPGVAGTSYTALTTTGAIGTTAADATHVRVGFTVEATRLVVRMARS